MSCTGAPKKTVRMTVAFQEMCHTLYIPARPSQQRINMLCCMALQHNAAAFGVLGGGHCSGCCSG